jgi:hypothetical protein
VLGLWDPLAALIQDIESDAERCDGYQVTRLGLDLSNPEDLAAHLITQKLFRFRFDP